MLRLNFKKISKHRENNYAYEEGNNPSKKDNLEKLKNKKKMVNQSKQNMKTLEKKLKNFFRQK